MQTECPICYTKPEARIVDSIANVPCEIEYRCPKCDTFVDYFAYGYWNSDQPRDARSFWFVIYHVLDIARHRDIFTWAKRALKK
jgi:hypothetical protein